MCNLTGNNLGEVIHKFIYDVNKTCFQACGNGKARVFGRHGKKNHENKNSYSRVSITMYHTCSISGCTGPTLFFLKGKSLICHFKDKWLIDNGASIGSTIVMNTKSFKTEEAWEKPTPHILKGMHNADHIVSTNPQWWMLEVFNGFGTHNSSLKSMQYHSNNKIIVVKEEG